MYHLYYIVVMVLFLQAYAHCMTAVSLLSCGCYMIKGYTLQHNLLRYNPLFNGLATFLCYVYSVEITSL